tara:strand:- start:59 stop:175 length:117 start_codon:yes stop_codon:yes gene_type:complete
MIGAGSLGGLGTIKAISQDPNIELYVADMNSRVFLKRE